MHIQRSKEGLAIRGKESQFAYECCNKECSIVVLNFLRVDSSWVTEPFHLINEVRATLCLPVREHKEEVDADASHKCTEVPAAKIELLIRSVVTHYLIVIITSLLRSFIQNATQTNNASKSFAPNSFLFPQTSQKNKPVSRKRKRGVLYHISLR